MTTAEPTRRFPTFAYLFRWRFLRRVVFGLVCFATLVALFYAEENVRGKRAWDGYVRERTAKGEKVYFSEFIPPPVADAENLVLCPLLKPALDLDFRTVTNGNVIRLVRGPNLWRDTNGLHRLQRLSRTWSLTEYHRATQGQSDPAAAKLRKVSNALLKRLEEGSALTNGWLDLTGWAALYRTGTNLAGVPAMNSPATEVLLALRPLEEDLGELAKEAARRPLARWPIYYNTNDPAGILLPHLARSKSIVALLQLRASASLAAGKTEEGLADLRLGFRMAETFRDEPFWISQLVRNACYGLLFQPLKEGLARHQFSDEQLTQVQRELARVDLLANYQHSMYSERGFQSYWNGYLKYLRTTNFDWKKIGNIELGSGLPLALAIMPSGWIYRNQIELCRLYDDFCLPGVDLKLRRVYPKAGAGAEKRLSEIPRRFRVLSTLFFPAISPRKFAQSQTQLDQALIACALERHQLVHGGYPEKLDTLSPRFMERIPHDLITGEPVKYHRTDNGQYLLYCMGWNERDDGGVEAKTIKGKLDLAQGDWVWRLPAAW